MEKITSLSRWIKLLILFLAVLQLSSFVATMMFGDNERVVDTASVPHSRLHKRHNALSYHRTREAIAAGITRFYHVRGDTNPADILSKHWAYAAVWSQLKPLLFWKGDTADLIKSENQEATPVS